MIGNTDIVSGTSRRSSAWQLLRKDLAVFIPRDRFLVGLVYLLAHPMVVPSKEAFFWLGTALALGLSTYVPIVEWHQETDQMLSSLPTRRRTIVTARYWSSLAWIGFSSVAWLSSGWLLGPFLAGPSYSDFGVAWATLPGVLTFLVVSAVIVSLFLPLYFRLGMGRALLAFSGAALVSYGIAALRLGLFPPAARIEAVLVGTVESVGPGWVLAGVLASLAILTAASGRVSVSGFRRRDL